MSNTGSGVYNANFTSNECIIENSIVAFNTINGDVNHQNAQLGFQLIDVIHSIIRSEDQTNMNDLGGNINADPRFENLTSYHLSACSPGRDNGLDSLNLCAEDYNGDTRNINGAIDMGTYEFQLTGTSGDICIRRIYVDNSSTGTNNGSSWTDAFTNLQDALSLSFFGDSILVAKGTYRPAQIHRDSSFVIGNGIRLFGGFGPLLGVTEMEDRDWNMYKSILSGDIGVIGDSLDNSYRVVEINDHVDSTT